MAGTIREPRWYHEPWPVALALLFMPPLGIVLMWVSRRISLRLKGAVSALIVAAALVVSGLDALTGFLSDGVLTLAATALELRGHGLSADKRWGEAVRSYQQAFRLRPVRRIALKMAYCYDDLGQLQRAEHFGWVAFLSRRKTLLDAVGALGLRDKGTEPMKKALAGARADAGLFLASHLLDRERHRERVATLVSEVLEKRMVKPSDPRLALVRAGLARREQRLSTAEKAAREVTEDLRYEYAGWAYEELAEVALLRKDRVRAIEMLCQSVKYSPRDLKRCRRLLGLVDEEGIDRVPFVSYVRALRLYKVFDGGEEAAPVLRKLYEKYPAFHFAGGSAYLLATYLFYDKKEYHEAAEAYEWAAARPCEDRVKAIFQAGRCYEKVNLPKKARRRFSRCLDLASPNHMVARWARSRLRRRVEEKDES